VSTRLRSGRREGDVAGHWQPEQVILPIPVQIGTPGNSCEEIV
jgi:hypothetical protein